MVAHNIGVSEELRGHCSFNSLTTQDTKVEIHYSMIFMPLY